MILYAIGVIIGIILFIYFLSTYESGKEKIRGMKQARAARQDPAVNADNVTVTKRAPVAPGQRMCPVCRTTLSKFEALYSSQVETKWGPKIMIYGCRYCYKPDEDPDKEKKSAY